MIDEQRFRDAMQDIEGEVRGGIDFEDALTIISEESRLPREGLRRRAELAYGDIDAAVRRLQQTGAKAKAEHDIKDLAANFAETSFADRQQDANPGNVFAKLPDSVDFSDIVRVQFWAKRTFASENERKLAIQFAHARLRELYRGRRRAKN